MDKPQNDNEVIKSIFHLNFINYDLEDKESQMQEVIGCKLNLLKIILSSFLCLTLVPLILMYWYDSVKYFLLFKDCFIQEASHLAIRNTDMTIELIKIKKIEKLKKQKNYGKIEYRYLPYEILDHVLTPVKFNYQIPCSDLISQFQERINNFVTNFDLQIKLIRYGKCLVDIPVKSIFGIVIDEVLNPFYLFQIFSVSLWFYELYYLYAAFILVASTGSIIFETYEIRLNMNEMKRMAEIKSKVIVERYINQNYGREDEDNNSINNKINHEEKVQDSIITIHKKIADNNSIEKSVNSEEGLNEPKLRLDQINDTLHNHSFMEAIKETNRKRKFIIKNRKIIEKNISVAQKTSEAIRYQKISSVNISPGEIIQIERGMKIPCDMILMEGTCIVDESMLTGESLPVPKSSLVNKIEEYNENNDKKYTLYAGTQVKSIKELGGNKVLGLVIRTGFSTINGGLFRYMLYPRPTKFTFNVDAYKFIAGYCLLAVAGLIIEITATSWDTSDIVLGFFDLITIVIPPALPAAMTVGISFSISRLKDKQISCIAPEKMNVAGTINVMCFDKTGTLTESSLRLVSLVPCLDKSNFGKSFDLSKKISSFDMFVDKSLYSLPENHLVIKLYQCMGSCHNLIELEEEEIKEDRTMDGDPLEVEMFKYSGFKPVKYENVKNNFRNRGEFENYFQPNISIEPVSILGVAKIYEFNAGLQRMSNITNDSANDHFDLFVKGSPEKIRELCLIESIPLNYDTCFNSFTKEGLRVIALAFRNIDYSYDQIKNLERKEAEKDLTFLGFLIFENLLKPTSKPSIDELHEANIDTIMLTGDNVWTAANVGIKCNIVNDNLPIYVGKLNENSSIDWVLINSEKIKYDEIIRLDNENTYRIENIINNNRSDDFYNISNKINENPQFAISNDLLLLIFEKDPELKNEMTKTLLKRTFVFARMSPDTKAQIISYLQKADFNVGMCGDGANDCKALKQSDVGISLSVAEASIAAPFSSKLFDISSVLITLKEGRAALTNSLECFKYMAMYSFIQFFSLILLNFISSSLTSNEYFIEDLFVIVPLAVTMSRSKSAEKLSKVRAIYSLISFPVLISIIGHTLLAAASMIGIFFLTQKQDFYVEFIYDDNASKDDISNQVCHLNTAVYLVSIFQLCFIPCAFTFGTHFRESIYSNFAFLINFFISLALLYLILMIYPYNWINYLINIKNDPPFSTQYQWIMFVWVSVNGFIIILYEQIVVENIIGFINDSSKQKV